MNNLKKKSLINLLLYVVMVIINYMGAKGMINGLAQKDVSEMYTTIVTPAGYAFSIWGIIYILLFVSVVALFTNAEKSGYREIVEKISPAFWLSCIFNILWIFSFSMVWIEVSMIMIFGLAFTLIKILFELKKINLKGVKLLYPITFGIYGGWISIANAPNLAAVMIRIAGRMGVDDIVGGLVLVSIFSLIILTVGFKLKNSVYMLPVAWALVAIRFKLVSLGSDFPTYILVIIALIFIAASGYMFVSKRKVLTN